MIYSNINKGKVGAYIKEKYGYASLTQFFKITEHSYSKRRDVLISVIRQFTTYEFVNKQLSVFNPYTWKLETTSAMQGLRHIKTADDLMADLNLLKKTRSIMIQQSRKRVLELAKDKKRAKSRDKDLQHVTTHHSKEEQRFNALQADQKQRQSKKRTYER